MVSRPLLVAVVSASLLVVVLGVDIAFNTTYYLDIEDDGAWVTFAQFPYPRDGRYEFPPGIDVDPNGTANVRVRVDNGFPWAFSEGFRLYVGNTLVADDVLTAPARGTGAVETSVSGSTLFKDGNPYDPRAVGESVPKSGTAWFRLEIGGDTYEQALFLQEASA